MPGDTLLILFVQVSLILGLSRLVGLFFARLHQPQVIGEMIAGIMLGPSLLGWLAPEVFNGVFPVDSRPYLGILSQVGVVFFLFLVGLELDPMLLRKRGHAAVLISHVSIIAPFLLGAALTLYLYPIVFNDTREMSFKSAALFMGAAMSITAFPVLARILTERNLHKTNVGAVTITCAAVDDVTAWCMLAFVVAVAKFEGMPKAIYTAVLAAVYVGAMFFVVKPFLRRLEVIYDRQGRLSQNVVSIIFLLVLVSAYTTEAIGIHALFGAFLMGCIMPKGTQFVRHLSEKLEDYTVVFLLPIFFAYSGLNTRIGLLNNVELWMITGLVIAVACVGKFGGSAVAARVSGMPWRESAAIGILMNTRGLMELVILNIGLQLKVITPAVFAMMVIMALVTTAMTSPLLHWVYPSHLFRLKPVGAGGTAGGRRERQFAVLVPVALPKSGGPLVELADSFIGADRDFSRVYALHLRAPVDHEVYRSGLDEAESPRDEALAPLLAQARGRSLPVEPLSFISRDVASDIAATALAKQVNLVLMGFHKPVIGKTILGGTVHRVLTTCPADVAIFVDRGFRNARRILVPYLGSSHDRLALDLASRMARHTGARVTVLHVVPPLRSAAGRPLNAKEAVERAFEEPGGASPVTFRVVEDPSPVGVVLYQAQNFDLLIVGVGEEWGLESHLFGWRAERIARDCPCSLLIVRKAGATVAPSGAPGAYTRASDPAHPSADPSGAGETPTAAAAAAAAAPAPADQGTPAQE